MKHITRIAAFLLVMTMALSMCACAVVDTTKAIVGTWQYEFNATAFLNEELEYWADAPLNINMKTAIPLQLTFRENGIGYISIDEEVAVKSLSRYLEKALPIIMENVYTEMEDYLGMSREEVIEYYEDYLGESLEEYYGSTIEAWTMRAFSSANYINTPLTYEIDGDRLYIAEYGSSISKSVYAEFKLSHNTLTILSQRSDPMGLDELEIDYPVAFKKQST